MCLTLLVNKINSILNYKGCTVGHSAKMGNNKLYLKKLKNIHRHGFFFFKMFEILNFNKNKYLFKYENNR